MENDYFCNLAVPHSCPLHAETAHAAMGMKCHRCSHEAVLAALRSKEQADTATKPIWIGKNTKDRKPIDWPFCSGQTAKNSREKWERKCDDCFCCWSLLFGFFLTQIWRFLAFYIGRRHVLRDCRASQPTFIQVIGNGWLLRKNMPNGHRLFQNKNVAGRYA